MRGLLAFGDGIKRCIEVDPIDVNLQRAKNAAEKQTRFLEELKVEITYKDNKVRN